MISVRDNWKSLGPWLGSDGSNSNQSQSIQCARIKSKGHFFEKNQMSWWNDWCCSCTFVASASLQWQRPSVPIWNERLILKVRKNCGYENFKNDISTSVVAIPAFGFIMSTLAHSIYRQFYESGLKILRIFKSTSWVWAQFIFNSNFLLTKIEKKYSNYLEKFQFASNQFFKICWKTQSIIESAHILWGWNEYILEVPWKFIPKIFIRQQKFHSDESSVGFLKWMRWPLMCMHITNKYRFGKLRENWKCSIEYEMRAVYQKRNARIKTTWNKYGFIGGWLEPEERRLVAEEGT